MNIFSKKNSGDYPLRGVIFMTMAIIIYAISDCFLKYTVMTHLHLTQILFIRALMRLIPMMIAIYFMPENALNYLKTKRIKEHLVRLIFSLLNTLAFFIAIKYTSLVNVYTMSYTTAIFTTVLGYLFLKEKVDKSQWLVTICGLVGVIVAINPQGNLVNSFGSFIALGGAFFAANNKVMMRSLSKTEHSLTIAIYPNIATVILCLPVAVFYWQPILNNQIIYLIIIGVLSAIAQYLIALALSMHKSSALAPLDYSSYLWVFLLDFITVGIIPDLNNIIGAFIIISSGLYVYFRANKGV